MHSPRRFDRIAIAAVFAMILFLSVTPLPATPTPNWQTWWTDSTFYKPNYPIAFVSVPRVEYPNTQGGLSGAYDIGTDVLSVSVPSAGSSLYLYLPVDGTVVQLFPRAVHLTSNLIDFDPAYGAVVEPSLSEDGRKIYFSYFHDARRIDHTTCNMTSGDCQLWSGADIYSIDISAWLTNTQTNPDNPAFVKRLTTRTYDTGYTHKQSVPDRIKDAMNIPAATAASAANEFGISYLHPTEMRTKDGLMLVYVSDKKETGNSNLSMNRPNHNFNLFVAPVLGDGSLGVGVKQFQYYTTTSAVSPTPLRDGIAFAYQATTEDPRNWHIQSIDSLGRWNTLLGYGTNPELFHLSTFCTGDPDGTTKDYLVATRYYNANNQGFGALWRQDLDPAVIGKNTYYNLENGYLVPYQVGSALISLNARSSDGISYTNPSGGYYGKITTPRCGGKNELYFTHSQTSANGRDYDPAGNKNIYKGFIAFRNSLASWSVGDISPAGELEVIHSRNDLANLIWPLPIVPWLVRTGNDATQRFQIGSAVTNQVHIKPGQPYAQIGSSSLSNTDRRPYDCRMNGPFNEWGSGTGTGIGNENDRVVNNQAPWTTVPAGGGAFCDPPDPATILGIEVNLTSNRTDLTTDIQAFESKRVLGVYDVRSQVANDSSFRAVIPANAPFEFQLIDRNYGMKLTDQASWHSLEDRELRANCGGCHQHESGASPVPWQGTTASIVPPVDFVNQTPKVKYDAHCKPVMVTSNPVASEKLPEWNADIWPGMQANCNGCHQTGGAGATAASIAALSWNGPSDEAVAYGELIGRLFASSKRGALGSQLFWAARGKRTDNRNNNLASYASHYTCIPGVDPLCTPAYQYGFHFGPGHSRFDQICNSTNGNQSLSDWIFAVGKWIDNGMPRDQAGYSANADRFHPTGDLAIVDSSCTGTQVKPGWWDDGNDLKSVVVTLISGSSSTILFTRQAVGTVWFHNSLDTDAPFTVSALLSNTDVLSIEVVDSSNNRQVYKKRVDQLKSDCALPLVPDPVAIP